MFNFTRHCECSGLEPIQQDTACEYATATKIIIILPNKPLLPAWVRPITETLENPAVLSPDPIFPFKRVHKKRLIARRTTRDFTRTITSKSGGMFVCVFGFVWLL